MQVKESVNAANLLLVGSQTGQSVPKPQADTMSSDFASFLTNAGEKVDAGVKEPKADTVKSENVQDSTYKADAGSEKKAVQDNASEKPVVASKAEDTPTDEVELEESMELADGKIQSLLEMVGQLFQNVMIQFQLSGAELSQQLESFGMTMEELLTPDGLKEFFLQMNSAEVSDLIVDENLNQELNSFLEEFEEIFDSLENVDFDLESILTDEKADMVFDEIFPEVSEVIRNIEPKTQEIPQQEMVQELQTQPTEEPEVVVTQTEKQETNDHHEMPEQQTENPKDSTLSSTEKSDWEQERTEPKNTFTNPILQAIENAVDNVHVQEISETDAPPVRGEDVINQIVEQVRVQMNQDTTSLEMQLYPEHLGKIQIHVVSKDGIMTARIVAETEAAKQAIENGLTNLKESMQEQNLKVDAIEVMVSTTGFERGNEGQGSETNNQTAKGRRKLDLSEPEQDVTDEEAAEEERMRASGSSVSYTA